MKNDMCIFSAHVMYICPNLLESLEDFVCINTLSHIIFLHRVATVPFALTISMLFRFM